MIKPRPYQTEIVNTVCAEWRNGVTRQLVSLPTGCHAAGTEILMYDGSVKKVEDVRVAELLMGPDSKPRLVFSLIRNKGRMYKITPVKGEPFVVNEEHVLSLEKTNERSNPGRVYESTRRRRENISVKEYLGKSKTYKHTHKLYRCAVDFPHDDIRIQKEDISPYFLGVLLGDGSFVNGNLMVTTPDKEVSAACYREAARFGLDVRREDMPGNAARNYHFVPVERQKAKKNSNGIREALKRLGLLNLRCGEKFIPYAYKTGSRAARLEILAGLIDTDGSLGHGFEFSSKSLRLAEDVAFVARSLGFAAYRSVKTVNGEEYQRVSISGRCEIIPTKVERKQASPRKQKKSVLLTGFSVEYVGEGDYYGFHIGGDHLYLMGDFTVTHNSGKTICFALLAQKLGVPTLVLAHREELLLQAKAKIRMVDPTANVGILQAQTLDGLYSHICVASVQTAVRPARIDALRRRGFQMVIVDEAHHATSINTYGTILDALGFMGEDREKLLVGVTATAFRGDGIGLGGVFDKIVYERTILAMIRGGYLCDARGRSVKTSADLSGVHTKAGDFATAELSLALNTEERNRIIVKSYLDHAAGRKAIVFCCDIKHSQDLAAAFRDAGVAAEAVWGAMEGRREILDGYAIGRIRVICNCNVLTEGFDDPTTAAVLLARPTKSRTLYIQMVGRGLRLAPEKTDCLVMDFADLAGKHNLCSLASLSGANAKFKVKQGQTLTEAMEEIDASEVWKKERIGDITSEEVELFERSRFVWTPTSDGHYKLVIGAETLWIRKMAGLYVPFTYPQGAEKATALADTPLPLGYAQGVAEDYARINAKNTKLIDRTSKWRKEAARERQLAQLKKWRIPQAEGIYRGEVSEMLSLEIERRTAKNNGPATAKQIHHIRCKLGIPVPETITFAEARRLIVEGEKQKVVA
ncbi:MAG: DEAD/DEAH box helicase family protein [Cloacibacillus sp.]|nr:DEAD/DEAH box helicase family protein [Cloacibacillus sp.]